MNIPRVDDRPQRRLFTPTQKRHILTKTDKACWRCKSTLKRGWHAHHDDAWALGGATVVENGWAVCPPCHRLLQNTARRDLQWPQDFDLWDWQQEALEVFREKRRSNDPNFFVHGTYGAGKTALLAAMALEELRMGRARRIAVVCHSRPLCEQWATGVWELLGLKLVVDGDDLDEDDGVATTYQAVLNDPQGFAKQCSQRTTIVLFDEIHHVGDHKAWGRSVKAAFEGAACRIMASATPFRTDRGRLPSGWVTYDKTTQELLPDVDFDYAAALRDNLVRPIAFVGLEGTARWKDAQGLEHTHLMSEALSVRKTGERLCTAISADTEMMAREVTRAYKNTRKLTREEGKLAKMVIITASCRGADQMAALYQRVTQNTEHKDQPAIIVDSRDPKATEKLEAFKNSDDVCLIAVQMVSEGVDIPPLRVLVWATNKVTDLLFGQLCGRLMRGPRSEWGWVYLPNDPRLIAMAATLIAARRASVIGEELPEDTETFDPETLSESPTAGLLPLSCSVDSEVLILHDWLFTPDQIQLIDRLRGETVSQSDMAERLVAEGLLVPKGITDLQPTETLSRAPAAPESGPAVSPLRPDKQRKQTRAEQQSRIGQLARLRLQNRGFHPRDLNLQIGAEITRINKEWVAVSRGRKLAKCGDRDLQEREQWIESQYQVELTQQNERNMRQYDAAFGRPSA